MMDGPQKILAVLAGGGNLPDKLVVGAQAQGWRVHMVTFSGQPTPKPWPEQLASHAEFALGQVGAVLKHLQAQGVTHVCMAGGLNKPSVFQLKPDAQAMKLLLRAHTFHDDALLRAVAVFLQEHGFTLLKVPDLLPDLVAPEGLLAKTKPTAQDFEDIGLARDVLAVVGDLDIGQAVVVHHGAVIGVEAVEGTDALLRRCAELRGGPTGGVVVKRSKPTQTDLADLPTVGPVTMQLLHELGYRGLAVQAGRTLVLHQAECVALANKHKLFLLGQM